MGALTLMLAAAALVAAAALGADGAGGRSAAGPLAVATGLPPLFDLVTAAARLRAAHNGRLVVFVFCAWRCWPAGGSTT